MPEITANIGFEKRIWNVACLLRGNLDASVYKHVVLCLIFLKYLSKRFEAMHDEIVKKDEEFEEDPDTYTEVNVFFIPAEARWRVVAEAAHMPEIGKVIDILDRTYEYCLSMFAEQEAKKGGEFFTPACVVKTLVEILKALPGTRLRSLMLRQQIRADRQVHREPFRAHQRHLRLSILRHPSHETDFGRDCLTK